MKAKKPEVKEKRLKLFVYGPAGVGKTIAALQFPQAIIIDTEKGTDFYADMIRNQGSVVFQSVNPDDIHDEIRELMTTKHEYKTLIIDPMTQVYNAIQEKWTRIMSNGKSGTEDLGMRFWGKVKGEMKAMQRMILSLDMNVIITSHQKDVYGENFKKMGVTFDSMKGDDYLFDLIFQIVKKGDKRIATTIKERAEVGKNKFPEEFEWSYANFCQFYGKDIIEREATPMAMATPEQVAQIKKLLEVVKVESDTIQKWFTKEDVDSFDEMSAERLGKYIAFVQSHLDGVAAPAALANVSNVASGLKKKEEVKSK